MGKELDVEFDMVGKVFESSFQNIKRITISSFVEGLMAVLVKMCQSTKTGRFSRLNWGLSRLDLQFFL